MMGKKTLAEIRADVAERFATSGVDPQEWFRQRIEKLKGKKEPNHREVETLKLLRDALASADTTIATGKGS